MNSKYKIWPIALSFTMMLMLVVLIICNSFFFNDAEILYFFFFLLFFLIFGHFQWEFKLVQLSNSNIVVINPVFRFIKKQYDWSFFDYCVVVDERTSTLR